MTQKSVEEKMFEEGDSTTLTQYIGEDKQQEYHEISRRDIFVMSVSLFIPFCLFRGLDPFTTFMASQQPWPIQSAATLNACMNAGVLLGPLLLPVLFVWESLQEIFLEMVIYGAVLTCLNTIPRFSSMWFHELCAIGRLEFGWSIATSLLITLAILNRHPIRNDDDEGTKNLSYLLWIDFFYALSSISFVFYGAILEKLTYDILFGIWAGLLFLPLLPLYFVLPKESHYDPFYNKETASSKKECGKCCGGLKSICSDWKSVALNLTICINAFCMNVFLTDVGLHLRFTLNQTAMKVGVIMLSYSGGSMMGHIFNRWCATSRENLHVLASILVLLFFTTMASNRFTNVGVSLNMVIGVSFFIGLGYQMLFYQSFLLSYEHETDSFLKQMSVMSCLTSYGIGAMVGDVMSIVIWNKGGWHLVTTVLASCTMVVVVLFVVLSVVAPKEMGVLVEDEEETRQLLVGAE